MTLKKIDKGLLIILVLSIFFVVDIWAWELRETEPVVMYKNEVACFRVLNKDENDIMETNQYIEIYAAVRYTLLSRKELKIKDKKAYNLYSRFFESGMYFLLFIKKENAFKEKTYFIFFESRMNLGIPYRREFNFTTFMENLSIISDKYTSVDFRELRKIYYQITSFDEVVNSKTYKENCYKFFYNK